MLDTLHEDLNRVINKPYTSGVENEGRPDEVVAKESWITYLKRNQSYINDLMGGQYRS
jgi:ubiquitin C-terminal hydrolase